MSDHERRFITVIILVFLLVLALALSGCGAVQCPPVFLDDIMAGRSGGTFVQHPDGHGATWSDGLVSLICAPYGYDAVQGDATTAALAAGGRVVSPDEAVAGLGWPMIAAGALLVFVMLAAMKPQRRGT